MAGADDGEVPPVESGDLMDTKALSDGDHGGVRRSQREVGVAFDQLGHTREVGTGEFGEYKFAGSERAQELCLSDWADSGLDHVADLGYYRAGYEQRTWVLFQ